MRDARGPGHLGGLLLGRFRLRQLAGVQLLEQRLVQDVGARLPRVRVAACPADEHLPLAGPHPLREQLLDLVHDLAAQDLVALRVPAVDGVVRQPAICAAAPLLNVVGPPHPVRVREREARELDVDLPAPAPIFDLGDRGSVPAAALILLSQCVTDAEGAERRDRLLDGPGVNRGRFYGYCGTPQVPVPYELRSTI